LQPLSNVNVILKHRNFGTVTDFRGSYSLEVTPQDTLVFSIVGYRTREYPAVMVRETPIVYLGEQQHVLNAIEIRGNIGIPWLPKIPPFDPWQNRTNNPSATPTPGFQGVQTFGPGYVMQGPLSKLFGVDKEKKQLKKLQEENAKSKGYAELVNSPEVKGKIMNDYQLTEERYYALLAKFNEKNKDLIYDVEANDLIALLIIFYAENTSKK
jgi:hypothetical protein